MTFLGDYELVRKLGEGGMGEVWLGRRPTVTGVAKLVAIKRLAQRHSESDRLLDMFLQEARLSMLLTHSNIVQVFDVLEVDGTCFMVMELVDGLDLAKLNAELRAQGCRLSPAQAAFIVAKLLRALAYAHELDHRGGKGTIIHRDISPQNVMLSVTGEVKLMDFGIARLSSDETSGAAVRGKPRYMPPEQLAGKTREATVDLFAVGAVLHELLDGKKFRSQAVDDGELYGMILAGRVPPLELEGVPNQLEALRKGLLAAKVEDRIPSARAALELLNTWGGLRDLSFELETLVREHVSSDALAAPALEAPPLAAPERAPRAPLARAPAATKRPRNARPELSETEVALDTSSTPETTPAPALAHTSASEITEARPRTKGDRVASSANPAASSARYGSAPSRAPMWLGLLALGLASAWGLLLLSTFLRGGPEPSPEPSSVNWSSWIGWSPCIPEPAGKTCSQVCAEGGGRCMPLGCPNPELCLPWTCDTATQLQGPAVCTDSASGSHLMSSCDAPIELGLDDSVRCCCEGLSEP